MSTMQALVLTEHNGPLKLSELPIPKPRRGEVLVRIAASGLNPLDIKIRTGAAAHAKHPLPLTLGIDLAGTVVEVGEEVHTFQVGDAVFGMTGGVSGIQGSLAQYAAVDARLLAHKPTTITLRQAAAMPLVFITAYAGLVDRGQLKPGQTVLVQGGAGGVGHMAIQIARALGAKVYATVSHSKHDLVKQWGATPIDYAKLTAEQMVDEYTQGEGFDLVFDTVGGQTLDASFKAVKQFGHVVSALGWGTHSLAPLSFREASYSGVFTLYPLLTGQAREHHGEILRQAVKMTDAGQLLPLLDNTHYKLGDAEAAYTAMANQQNTGKVVVEIS